MYDELIAELRQHHCDAKEDDTQEVCEECSYDVIIVDKSAPSGIASVCVCGLMNRAADAIEEITRENKELSFRSAQLEAMNDALIGETGAADALIAKIEAPKWIPVTERLPEEAGKYLVCGRWRGKQTEMWVCEFMTLGCLKGWANGAANPVVSHWMPLPQGPVEE